MAEALSRVDWSETGRLSSSNSYILAAPEVTINVGFPRLVQFPKNAAQRAPFLRQAVRQNRHLFFQMYAKEWIEDTKWASSTSFIKAHRRFSDLVRMGDTAVSEVLQRMSDGDVQLQWFPLLKTISGEDPVPSEHRGRINLMAQAWLDWGKRRNIA